MTEGQEPEEDQAPTEAIPAVASGEGIASTKEIPAVDGTAALTPLVRTNGPASQRFESSPDHAPFAVPSGPTYPPHLPSDPDVYPPLATSEPAVSPQTSGQASGQASQPTPQQAPGQGRPPLENAPSGSTSAGTGSPRPSPNALLIGAIVVLLVAIIGVVAWKVLPGDSTKSATPSATPSASATTTRASITSYSPSGSGFEQRGTTWTTQTYTSETFGNLKKGVALVIDLGDKRALTDVMFTSNGATVVLRGADSTGQFGDGYTQVGQPQVSDGSTTLSGKGGGEHRYWLIYVSKLPASDGGFAAKITDIKIHA